MARAGAAALALSLVVTVSSQEGGMSLTIQEARAKHESRLMAMPGVVTVGIGLDDQGATVIVVGLDRPRPESLEALPKALEGYPVHIRIIGPVKAQEP